MHAEYIELDSPDQYETFGSLFVVLFFEVRLSGGLWSKTRMHAASGGHENFGSLFMALFFEILLF